MIFTGIQTILIVYAFIEGKKYLKKYADQVKLEEKISTITETYRALFEFLSVTDDVLTLGSFEEYEKLKVPTQTNDQLKPQLDLFLQRYEVNSNTHKSESRRLQGLIDANLVVIDNMEFHRLWNDVLEKFKDILSPLNDYRTHVRYGGFTLIDLHEIARDIPNGAFSTSHSQAQKFRGSISVLKSALSEYRKNIHVVG
ncbi:hypothetical protein IFO69_02110 [Echinicola sp. CAU 1574]|uniref:Uncharacterized protein n=2 Tax=Echinicola arenosa TaxID=2774144 RepID=A0ABR9AGV5_9BACT|nr:hypothetical protein [Echinicola arenosa]